MSNLKLRKIPFKFEGVDFIWNPDNPGFSILMNKISFFVIALERYFCRAVRDAEPLIKDAGVKQEARLFIAQEAAHAAAHRRHVKALTDRYPGLQEALDGIIAHFDTLYASKELAYHLGYAGGLESVFTPTFKMFLDHRDALFGKGDKRVASLFVWHFCEEIEHRGSALMVYDAAVGKYLYRARNFSSYMAHVTKGLDLLERKFKQHVPGVPERYYEMQLKFAVPRRSQLKASWGVLLSQLPGHNPVNQAVPDYFHEWMKLHDAGADMTQIYGAGPQEPGT